MRGAHVHLILEALQARRELEANSALAPFAVLGDYIFGDKGDRHGPADELVLLGAGLRLDEREVRGAIGGRDGYEATIGLNAGVKNQLETELINVEIQAEVEVANVNRNRLETQVRVLTIQANSGAACPLRGRVAHGRDYKAERVKPTLVAGVCQAGGQHAAPLQIHRSVFGPAEGGEGVVEAGKGQADDVEVAAFDARDVAAGAALDAITSSLIVGLAGRKVAVDLFRRKHGEVHQGGLDEGEPLGVGKANEGDTREDRVSAAGKFFEHVAGVVGGTGLAEDAPFERCLRRRRWPGQRRVRRRVRPWRQPDVRRGGGRIRPGKASRQWRRTSR